MVVIQSTGPRFNVHLRRDWPPAEADRSRRVVARTANGDDALRIVRDLKDVQLPAHYHEDFGYMLIKIDNDFARRDGAQLAMCVYASLLGGGEDGKHLAGNASRRRR